MTNDTTDLPNNPIAEKIMKLLNQANHPNTTPAEAAVFAAKAEALMFKWQIDETMLSAAGKRPDDKIVRVFVNEMPWTTYKERGVLWQEVARCFNCRVLAEQKANLRKGAKGRLHLIGFESDVDRVLMLAASLDMTMASEATRHGGTYYDKREFRFAFIDVVVVRLKEAYRKATDEVATPGVGLAIIDRKTQVDKYLEGKIGKARNNGPLKGGSYDARAAGYLAGQRADIGQTRVGGNRKAIG